MTLRGHRFDSPSAVREAIRASGVARKQREAASRNRLIRIDGKVEILHEVSTRLGVPIRRLLQLYAEGVRTSEKIMERSR